MLVAVGGAVSEGILTSLAPYRDRLRIVGLTTDPSTVAAADCDLCVSVAPAADSSAFEGDVVAALRIHRPALVLPCRDADQPTLARIKAANPQAGAPILVGSVRLAEAMNDKLPMLAFMARCGLRIAPTASTPAEVAAMADAHGFPLVAKPRRGSGTKGVYILFDEIQLRHCVERGGFVFQPYVSPPPDLAARLPDIRLGVPFEQSSGEETFVAIRGIAGPGGEAVSVMAVDVINRFGRPFRLTRRPLTGVDAAAAVRTAAELAAEGYVGPFALQARVDRDGALTYFEMLTRLGGGTAGFVALGLNQSRLLVEMFSGLTLPETNAICDTVEWQAVPRPVLRREAEGIERATLAADRPAGPRGSRTIPLFVPSMPTFDQLRGRLEAVAGSGTYANFGPASRAFEGALADRLGVTADRVSVVTNATVGLAAALLAVTGGAAGLCAMPAWTHAATAAAARLAGLRPYFLDVREDDWQLDPERLMGRLAEAPERVVAVVTVAPFGSRIDIAGWAGFQARSGIPVVVDAAAAFDTWSDTALVSVVSFHATKAFGIGEGGAVLCPDPALGRRLRATINLGMQTARVATAPGLNAKLDEFRAAIGLAALEIWPETRTALVDRARAYDTALATAGCPVARPEGMQGVASSAYAIALPGPDAGRTVEALAGLGVQARRWWGEGCHRAPAFADCPREDLPVTDSLAGRVIGLPLHAGLSREDIAYVVDCLSGMLATRRPASAEIREG